MKLQKALALLLALLLCLSFAFSVTALTPQPLDFGDFGGGDDYGGGGGDYGDYGGYDYGGSDYSYDSSSDATPKDVVIGFIVILVIVVISCIGDRKKRKQRSNGGAVRNPGATPAANLNSMASFRERDPSFDEADFTAQVSKLYVQMQNAWCARDLTPLRPYLTASLLGQSQQQIDNYIRQKQTPHVEKIAVLGVELRGWTTDNVNDSIVCRIRTRIVDYVADDRTGEVVNGSKDKCKFMEYEWTMIRSVEQKTEKKDGVTTYHCASCGAPIDLNQSAVCPYCGTVAESSVYGWTLSGIKGISQRTE